MSKGGFRDGTRGPQASGSRSGNEAAHPEKQRVAPGKVTRTSKLAQPATRPEQAESRVASPRTPPAPVQQKRDRAVGRARDTRNELTARWLDTVIRPDLHPQPVDQEHGAARQTEPKAASDAHAAVQMHGHGAEAASDVHALAAQGLSGTASTLPHLDRIQRSFGAHDVRGIEAHIGGPATQASQAMGADAYATGNHVAFGAQPDLHTAAHEAAHVVQQHAGVQLAGGVGQAGDAYEQHADAVADKVVRGESAEALLDVHGGSSGHAAQDASRRIQAKPSIAPFRVQRQEQEDKKPADKDVLEKIDDLLSYGAFDWAITDGEAREVLQILRGLDKAQRRRIIAKMKSSGKLERLLDNISSKDKAVYGDVLAAFPAEMRLKLLISYGWLDWAVTDAEARECLQILQAASPADRAAAIKWLEDNGYLARLLDNVAATDKAAFKAVMDAFPPAQRIQVLLQYEILLDWVITDAEATEALDVLLAVPAANLDDVLAKIKLDRLISNVPASRHGDFQTLCQRSTDPAHKAVLWQVAFVHEAEQDADASGVSKADDIKSDTRKEAEEEVDKLLEEYQAYLAAAATPADRQKVKQKYLQELAELDNRKRLELQIELGHNMRFTNEDATRVWSLKELEQMQAAFERLPDAHVSGNTVLKKVHRDDIHKDGGNIGGTHSGGVITIYDAGISGSYRATGETSHLSEHKHGGSAGYDKLSPLEETVTHEIGHDIHDINPQQFQNIQDLAGWESLSKSKVLDCLKADKMPDADAGALVGRLDADRKQPYYSRNPEKHAGWVYMVDPYDSSGYLRREAGHLPGDAESPEAPGQKHHGYAASNPKDHFAELYAHMVHVPERAYKDYVELPEQRLQAAQQKQKQAQVKLKALRASSAAKTDIQKAEKALRIAKRELTERQDQYDALSKQWDTMREQIFGVDSTLVDTAYQELLAAANAKPDAPRKAAARKIAEDFKKNARKAATPKQLTRMKDDCLANITAI